MRVLIHFSKCGGFLLTVPRHRSRGGQTILGGMAGSTLTICSGFLLTVPRHHNRGGHTILGGMVGSTLKTLQHHHVVGGEALYRSTCLPTLSTLLHLCQQPFCSKRLLLFNEQITYWFTYPYIGLVA